MFKRCRDSPLKSVDSICLSWCLVVVSLMFSHSSCGQPAVSATAKTHLCSYTLVVNEFDVSKCPSSGEHAQADGVGLQNQRSAAYSSDLHSQNAQPAKAGEFGYDSHTATPIKANTEYRNLKLALDNYDNKIPPSSAEIVGLNSLVRDMESKLLDEMVRSRELNSTLARHEHLLSRAQTALEYYKANFTTVFRTMMLMERKLHRQRKINKSLNKKLSNVILDVVEVNNMLTHKLPTGDASKSSKTVAVESSSAIRSCPGITDKTKQFKDCAEVYNAGHTRTDVYFIKPLYASCPIPVWCDMEAPESGWLVIQRRRDGTVNFDRPWNEYRAGFGDVSGEHWLGNDNMFLLTNQDRYQLRIDLWDFSGNRVFALYTEFKIDGERDGYRLHISGYNGSAKDSLHQHNNRMFSTRDRDNDGRREANCAQEWEAGWWFDNCWFALLNGPYHNRSDVSWRGLAWNHWKREQLRGSEMKIRPVQENFPDD